MKYLASVPVKLPVQGTYCLALYHGDVPDESQLLIYSTNPGIIINATRDMVSRLKTQRKIPPLVGVKEEVRK